MHLYYFKPVDGFDHFEEEVSQNVQPHAQHSTASHLAYAIQGALRLSTQPLLNNHQKRIRFKALMKAYPGTATLLKENPLPQNFSFDPYKLSQRLARNFFLSKQDMQFPTPAQVQSMNAINREIEPYAPSIKRIKNPHYYILQVEGARYIYDNLAAQRFLTLYFGQNQQLRTVLQEYALLSQLIKPITVKNGTFRITGAPGEDYDFLDATAAQLFKQGSKVLFPEIFYFISRENPEDKMRAFLKRALLRLSMIVLLSGFLKTMKNIPESARPMLDTAMNICGLYSALTVSFSTFFYYPFISKQQPNPNPALLGPSKSLLSRISSLFGNNSFEINNNQSAAQSLNLKPKLG